jgi:hypothetical protein
MTSRILFFFIDKFGVILKKPWSFPDSSSLSRRDDGPGEKIAFPFARPCFIIDISAIMHYLLEAPWISLPA